MSGGIQDVKSTGPLCIMDDSIDSTLSLVATSRVQFNDLLRCVEHGFVAIVVVEVVD